VSGIAAIHCSIVSVFANAFRIFESCIKDLEHRATYVQVWRDQHITDVYGCLASPLWTNSPNAPSSIQEASDILVMFIAWEPNARRELLKLDQTLVLDRFMTKHQAWAMQARAVESMAAGEGRRAQDAIDKLTRHKVGQERRGETIRADLLGSRYRNEPQSVSIGYAWSAEANEQNDQTLRDLSRKGRYGPGYTDRDERKGVPWQPCLS
jgi:hypothetical protein